MNFHEDSFLRKDKSFEKDREPIVLRIKDAEKVSISGEKTENLNHQRQSQLIFKYFIKPS